MGAKLALWALQVRRDRERLVRARHAVSVGKLSGRGRHLLQRRPGGRALRLPAPRAPARSPPPRSWPGTATPSSPTPPVGGAPRRGLRHRDPPPPADRGRRGRRTVPQGSPEGLVSAMPHKRNPVRCEQLCGLARVRAGRPRRRPSRTWPCGTSGTSPTPAVERVILPDSSMLAYYLLVKFTEIVEGLEVFPDRMAGEPGAVPRAGVLPARAPGPRRVRPRPRRRVPHRAGLGHGRLGGAPPVRRHPPGRTRRDEPSDRGTAGRLLRLESAPWPTPAGSSMHWTLFESSRNSRHARLTQ